MSSTKSALRKITIRVSRVFEMLEGIELCSKIDGSYGFSYALARNKKILMDEAKTIEDQNKPGEDFEAFQRERQELIEKKLAKKKGDQIEYIDSETPGVNGKVPVYKDPEKAEKELEALAKKHTEAIEKRKEKNRKYIKFFNEGSIDIEVYMILTEHLPEEKLTPGMVYGILELIEESEQ